MKKLISFIFILFLTINLFSQHYSKYTNHWYFHKNAGLDFSNYNPVADTNGAISYNFPNDPGRSACMSDYYGNLLFYTDCYHVFNRYHDTMPNGYGLKGGIINPAGYIYFSIPQNVIFPLPKSASKYYHFLASGYSFQSDSTAYYSIIDMAADSGRGDVVSKNIPFMSSSSTKVGAVKHANGECYWLILHKRSSNAFYAYSFCGNNDPIVPVISNVGQVYFNEWPNYGNITISPDGQKIAVTSHFLTALDSIRLELFDFDASTGVISNPLIIPIGNYDDYTYVAFSSDSKKLYAANAYAGNQVIYQFNLAAGSDSAIISSKTYIHYAIPNSIFSHMQLGLDGKIYVSHYYSGIADPYIGVINSPNTLGTGCNYVQNGVYLGYGHQAQSVPNFVSSYLLPPMEYSYSNTCEGDTVSFILSDSVSTVLWDFGDTASMNNASTLYHATHYYANPGSYTVKAACLHYGMHDTVIQTINIYPKPTLDLGQDTLIDSNTVLVLDAGAGFASYLWSNGATTSSISINGANLGIGVFHYWVEATDSNGCSAIDSIKVYKNSTSPGFEKVVKNMNISVYPNPADEQINIEFEKQLNINNCEINIYNILGQEVIHQQLEGDSKYILNISELKSGMYFYSIISDGSVLKGDKFIKE